MSFLVSEDHEEATTHSLHEFRTPVPFIESTVASQSKAGPSTHNNTKSTNTYQPTNTYQASTGYDPYGHKKADIKRKLITAEMTGFWNLESDSNPKPTPSLWDEFFPDCDDGRRCLDQFIEDGKFVVDPSSDGEPDMYRWTGRWRKMPTFSSKGTQDGKNNEQEDIREKKITEAFVPIMNHIISTLGLEDSRVTVDGQEFPIRTRDNMLLKPDIFLWGKGSPAFPPIDGKPDPKPDPKKSKLSALLKKSPRKKVAGLRPCQRQDKAAEEGPPRIDWPWCCVPIEVKTASGRGGAKVPPAFAQLGAYVREVFGAQTNRRFIPSLILTEKKIEFLLWNRAGVIASEGIDYHAEPLRLCSMLVALVTWNDQQLGFDPTIFYHNNELRIRTREVDGANGEHIEYVVEETLSRAYTLRGRGSTCWRVHRLDNDNIHYIIQDSWVEGGMAAEQDILLKIEAIRATDGISGIAPLVHIENVLISMPGMDPFFDTTRCNRRHGDFFGIVELHHTRTVLLCRHDCTAMERFTSQQEFLNTLHDVVKGLGELHTKAAVVHRDIVPWNILMQPGAPEGSRGILIDFSCAALTDSQTIRSRPEKTPGCNPFMPHKALLDSSANSHTDELEAFYWVIIFIVCLHSGPNLSSSRSKTKPTGIRLVDSACEDAPSVAMAKRGILVETCKTPVHSWFGKSVGQLVEQLHGFLRSHIRGRLATNSAQGYAMVVDYFRQAMAVAETKCAVTDKPALEEEGEGSKDSLDIAGKGKRSRLDDTDSLHPRKKMRITMEFEVEGSLLAEGHTIYIEAQNRGSAEIAIVDHSTAIKQLKTFLPLDAKDLDPVKNMAQKILSQQLTSSNKNQPGGATLGQTREANVARLGEMSMSLARIEFS